MDSDIHSIAVEDSSSPWYFHSFCHHSTYRKVWRGASSYVWAESKLSTTLQDLYCEKPSLTPDHWCQIVCFFAEFAFLILNESGWGRIIKSHWLTLTPEARRAAIALYWSQPNLHWVDVSCLEQLFWFVCIQSDSQPTPIQNWNSFLPNDVMLGEWLSPSSRWQ